MIRNGVKTLKFLFIMITKSEKQTFFNDKFTTEGFFTSFV